MKDVRREAMAEEDALFDDLSCDRVPNLEFTREPHWHY